MKIVGPDYGRLDRFEANLSGTIFSFLAPEHNHPRAPKSEFNNRQINISDIEKYDKNLKSNRNAPPTFGLTHRYWMFSNQRFLIFSEDLAQTDFEPTILHFPEFDSLFNEDNI